LKTARLAAGIALGLLSVYIGISFFYPAISPLKKENPAKTAMMKYRERQWASEGKHVKISQRWVPFQAISPYAAKAVLIAEDDKFWHHDGFDFEGMETALEKDIKKRRLKAGGSTITQQLAKNLFLSPSRNPVRKLKEAILAWRMEKTLTKRRILEIYLNVAEWGPGIFGIDAAARHYFGVPAGALSPEQAARLAVILPNPNRLSPVNPSRYVVNRANIVYRIMVRRGAVMPDYEEVMDPARETADRDKAFSTYTAETEQARPKQEAKPLPFMGVSTLR